MDSPSSIQSNLFPLGIYEGGQESSAQSRQVVTPSPEDTTNATQDDLFSQTLGNLIKLQQGLSSVNEGLSDLANFANSFKSYEYFNGKDHVRNAQFSQALNKHIESGKLKPVSPLLLNNEKIPPYKAAIENYSAERRIAKYNQIAEGHLKPGCSIGLVLITDEIYESTMALLSLQDARKPQIKNIFVCYLINVKMLIGLVSKLFTSLCKYQGSLGFNVKIDHNIEQAAFLASRRSFLSDSNDLLFNKDKIQEVERLFKSTKEGKRCIDALLLLEDYFMQDIRKLFEPFNDQLDISDHFLRLSRRCEYLNKALENNYFFSFIDKSVIKDKKYADLFIKKREENLFFFKTLFPHLSSLHKNKDPLELAKFWSVLQTHVHFGSKRAGLLEQLAIDINSGCNNLQINAFFAVSQNLECAYLTMVDESYLILMIHLIRASKVENLEIDACVENLINGLKVILEYDVEHIWGIVESLPDSVQEDNYIDIWKNDFESIRENFFSAYVQHIELRLERCKQNPNDKLERALILRDVLLQIGGACLAVVTKREESLKHLKSIPGITPEYLVLHQELEDLNLMQRQGILVFTAGIKALIGRCFDKIETNVQEAQKQSAKDLSYQIEESKKAEDELLKPAKKKKRKKKKTNSNQDTSHLANQPLPQISQSVEQEKSSKAVNQAESINSPQIDKPISQKPVKRNKQASEELPQISQSLLNCEKNLQVLLEKREFNWGTQWQGSRLVNLFYLLESLMETQGQKGYSRDLIFEQTDLLRRSVEGLLEVTTIYSMTPLEEIRSIGHHAEKLGQQIIQNTNIPENIRKLLWKMLKIPAFLAEANKCVNYPAEATAKRNRLNEQGKNLIDFLAQVEREDKAITINETLRAGLFTQHQRMFQRTVYFMAELLEVINDPSKNVDGDLPKEFAKEILLDNVLKDEPLDLQAFEENKDGIDIQENQTELPIPQIVERKGALVAIETALAWINIQMMNPVQGSQHSNFRIQERNIALRNCEGYLRRLKEKLVPERSRHAMSTILGQCNLMRRAQKELTIAGLYHCNKFEENQHLIQARDIRYENNPIMLMKLLKTVKAQPKELPQVPIWMFKAHQIVSYPGIQNQETLSASSLELQKVVKQAYLYTKDIRNGEFENRQGSLAIQKQELVCKNETERVFPALATFLYTLKFGFSLYEHSHLK